MNKMKKIVVLDDEVVNPGDISWERLEKLGDEFLHFPRTSPEEFAAHVGDADCVLTMRSEINKACIQSAMNLKYIGVIATGYEKVDVDAAHDAGITVTNIDSSTSTAGAIAQGTMALLLEMTNHVGYYSENETIDKWRLSGNFAYYDTEHQVVDLKGKAIGIVGFGNIGQRVAKMANAFGMNVLATTKSKTLNPDPQLGLNFTVEYRDLDDLLRESDVVSLNLPYVSGTPKIIDERALDMMKPGAFLVNTARGGLVDEHAVSVALHAGKLRGYAVDVFSKEPPDADNPLLFAPRRKSTAHNTFTSRETREKFMNAAIDNLENHLNGRPTHLVPTRIPASVRPSGIGTPVRVRQASTPIV